MSSDPDDRTSGEAAPTGDQSDEMEQRLEQLDEHIDDAAKKAEAARPASAPAEDDPVDDVAGGGTDNEEHVDDPEGPIVGGS